LREIAYSSVVEVLERGLAHTGKREVLLTGGVAASRVLNEKIEAMARLHGATFKPIPAKYAGDNGVMIAITGLAAYKWGYTIEVSKAFIRQRWRIDQVDVPWYYEFP
jgi:N6-L-threonylcarbamoyladenine synthase